MNAPPRALRIVAWLFLLGGIGSLLTIVISALHNQWNLDFGVLGLPVYFGLQRFSPGWRTCALVLLVIAIFFSLIVAALALVAREGHFDLFGQHIASIPSTAVSVIALGWMALAIWEWRVLNRPEVVELFERNK